MSKAQVSTKSARKTCASLGDKSILSEMKNFLILAFALKASLVFGFDCEKLSKDELYNQAHLIFLGNVIYVSDTLASVKVVELFKGNANDTIIWLISQGELTPSVNSTWLIYGYRSSTENAFYIGECSASKSFNAPFSIHDVTLSPPPTPGMMAMNSEGRILHQQMLFDRALGEFYFDVASLRARKASGESKLINERHDQLEKLFASLIKDLTVLRWSTIILIIALVGSIIVSLRKK